MPLSPEEERRSPSAFVSYTHEDDEHRIWVESLARDLASNGIDLILDQWELTAGADLFHFMESGIEESTFVLAICTPIYKEKADNRSGGGGFETRIAAALLADDLLTRKFIPILRKGIGKTAVPTYLRAAVYRDFSDDARYEETLRALVEDLYQVSKRPPSGWRKGDSTVVRSLFGVVASPSGHESQRESRKFGEHRPPITLAPSVMEIRSKHGVREMQPIENDLPLSRLTPPIFGFCTSWALNTDPRGIVGGTGLSTLSLSCRPGGTVQLEIHKLASGEVYVVGYTRDSDIQTLTNESRKNYMELMLLVEPYEEHRNPVGLPYSRLLAISNRSVSGGPYLLDLTVD